MISLTLDNRRFYYWLGIMGQAWEMHSPHLLAMATTILAEVEE